MAFHIRHTEKDQQNDTANPKRPPNLKRSEIPRYQHAQRERKKHSQHPSPEVQSVERPAHANHAVAHHVGQGKPRKSYSKQYHQDGQRFVAQPVDEKSIKNIPDIFKKQRPAGTVQRKHLPVSAYVITRSRIGRYEKHRQQEGQHDCGGSHLRAVPLHPSLDKEGNATDNRSHDNHRMKANQSSLEEAFQGQIFFPAVVVSIADDKTRKYKEKVDGQVAVVDDRDEGAPSGKRETFKNVIKHHQQCGHSSQSVEQFIMRFRIGKGRGRN